MLKAALDDLILPRVEYSLPMNLVLIEVSFIESSTLENANTSSMPFAVLEAPFVVISIGHLDHALSASHSFADCSLVVLNSEGFYWLQLGEDIPGEG